MNEDALLLLPREVANAIDGILRTRAGANNWCDHCWHGDHDVCKKWWDDNCACNHEEEATGD